MKIFRVIMFWSATFLIFTCAVLAAPVPPISPADFSAGPASPEAHWIWAFMASPLAVGAAAWVARFFDEWIRARRLIKENAVLRQCYTFASHGVASAYYDGVRELKHRAADGKLTEEEKKLAMERAVHSAVTYARNNGVDMLKKVGPEAVRGLIEQALRNRKAGQFVAGPLGPFPELAP